jgi:hypothetical protein
MKKYLLFLAFGLLASNSSFGILKERLIGKVGHVCDLAKTITKGVPRIGSAGAQRQNDLASRFFKKNKDILTSLTDEEINLKKILKIKFGQRGLLNEDPFMGQIYTRVEKMSEVIAQQKKLVKEADLQVYATEALVKREKTIECIKQTREKIRITDKNFEIALKNFNENSTIKLENPNEYERLFGKLECERSEIETQYRNYHNLIHSLRNDTYRYKMGIEDRLAN